MSELDLGLKVNSRRLLWRMGFTTRVDVPLRTPVPSQVGRPKTSRFETFTDLDVLGIALVPGFALRKVISDCKTTQRGSTERMFWIRGVSDFFDADDAWMVRSKDVTAASRQLASRLGISVMEPADLSKLEGFHPTDLDLENGPLALLFDEAKVSTFAKVFTVLDKKLERLLAYRQFDYWVFDEYRNLQQVVAHLNYAQNVLDPNLPAHRALFIDCAWLYALSLAQAARHVRAVHVGEVDIALQQYLFGGQTGLLEKRKLAAVLERFAPGDATSGVLPGWYPQLLELLVRHLRRPDAVIDELRYAEWVAEAQVAKEHASLADAFGSSFDPLPAKLLSDICGFLVTAAGLDPKFRIFSHGVFLNVDSDVSRESNVEPVVSSEISSEPEHDLDVSDRNLHPGPVEP
ncbi:hypothetical protein [Cryobacterium zhongshanensis]|uniref:Uncharacterized protein n=1 Tax=Cryobacterium zhongshanensis TaxID=2928153 RepID=A0AA41QUA9_9MICO|nr:hypothetical protein [Cryobacterium zhongshanensis]MCI4657133.1 hypothetical protein [Cryobacterium zhongshanensis]